MLRAVFHLALRQTEGLIGSILHLLGLDLRVPDHTTIARRARTVPLPAQPRSSTGPVHLLVDSTGLKLCGPEEWLIEKHGTTKRRSWKKLHIGVDAASGRIVAATLTDRAVDDAAQVGTLLDQIGEPVASVMGDGAYDRTAVYAAVHERHREAMVVAPPRADAGPGATARSTPNQRDRHIQLITERDRLGWQRAVHYGCRSLGEVAMMRYKQLIGRTLRVRSLPAQKVEAAVGCKVMNIMTNLGMPTTRKVA